MSELFSPRALNAKARLVSFVDELNAKLPAYFETEKARAFGFNERQRELVRLMIAHAEEHNLRPSKRLRGSFVYYGYLLGNTKVDQRIWNAVIAIELVQTALLMLDDVMDRDDTRRGQPTTHRYFEGMFGGDAHYGESMAIMVGDAVLVAAYELLLDSGFDMRVVQPALRQLLRGTVNTAFGQAFDITLEHLQDLTEDDVLTLHRAKTGLYTGENPLFTGALLGEVVPEAFPLLHDYAMEGIVAFQLQDDVLGVFGDPEKTGKSADSDLLQGKVTLLALKVFEKGGAEEEALRAVWGKRTHDAVTEAEIARAKDAIVSSGSLDYSKKLARELAEKAAASAEKLRVLPVNTEAVDYIQGVAEYMVEREV